LVSDWREQLAKLVRARGTDRFPLSVFDVAPSCGQAWPDSLPSCKGLRDFYALCNGGPLSLQYNWLPLSELQTETARWRELLHDYQGDGRPVLLPGRHLVLANDSGGAPVIWDAESDRLASFFWKGGDWEPYILSFEAFMEALFFRPEQVSAGDMWLEALGQLAELA
jgi:hypothetical protein